MTIYSNANFLITALRPQYSVPGASNGVDSHGLLDLCELFSCQLDVTCRTILNSTLGVSVCMGTDVELNVTSATLNGTYELPGMGTMWGPSDATHAIHSCAAVIPFLEAIASRADTSARL
jgi:hypothetical protein